MGKTLRPERDPHRGVFFRSWLRDPFHVGAVAPSSRWLAKLMATDVHAGACVVELGAGTGTLTTALIDSGVRQEDLFLVDQHADFTGVLQARFPRANVVQADAATLTQRLVALRGRIDYVISGLPILWFSRETKAAILSEAFELLKPEGRFQQFTYLGRPPVGPKLLAELGLRPTLLGIAPMNLPPAFVYRFTRRSLSS